MGNERTVFRTWPWCEAGCGLAVTVVDGAVTRIRGDRDDVFSKGFLCPKGSSLKQLHDDPDRLRRPLVKRDGVHVEVSWDEAFAYAASELKRIQARYGRDSIGGITSSRCTNEEVFVVQKMVRPVSAGVAFTLNPADGDRSTVAIDSAWGFGEGVVSGEITPDNFLVDKVVREIGRRVISVKECEFALTDHDTVEKRDLEPERASAPSLTDDEIKKIIGFV
mgnify:CR=1 FL=1